MLDMHLVLQQQWQQGHACAQQAVLSEQMGHQPWARQCYEQAIALMSHAMRLASQHDLPVRDNLLFHYAFCHFNAARVKAAAGWRHEIPPHLEQALRALEQALALNPHAGKYHMGVGTILLAQGQVAAAIPALQRAGQLNPLDAWSQWMLALIYAAQGPIWVANRAYIKATRLQAHLPNPWQFVQQHRAAGLPGHGAVATPSQPDWFALIMRAIKLVTNGFTLAPSLMQAEPEYVA